MIYTFDQFYDRINGELYKDVPPPVPYNLASYALQITSSPINNCKDGASHELRPLSDEDMGRYAADDVVDRYTKIHKKNPLRLGKPMSDGQFKKFMGHTW